MNGADFLADVRRRLKKELGRDPKDKDLVDRFDITRTALHRWKNSPDLSALQMGALLFRSTKNEIAKSEANAITPLVEFLELHIVQSKGGSKFEIFGVSDENKNEHPYLGGLRRELESHRGIYIFHDSRGRALYVGKTRSQTLWREINLALNRDREVQKIRRVRHPEIRVKFKTSEEKRRQIRLRSVQLHQLAKYVSAYKVTDGLIGELESLLIRSFANDLLNARMENFTWQNGEVGSKSQTRISSRKLRNAGGHDLTAA